MTEKLKQIELFDLEYPKDWEKEWKDMPEFVQHQQKPYTQIIFRFANEKDLQDFAKLINQKLTNKTKSAWYPFKSHWSGIQEYYATKNEE